MVLGRHAEYIGFLNTWLFTPLDPDQAGPDPKIFDHRILTRTPVRKSEQQSQGAAELGPAKSSVLEQKLCGVVVPKHDFILPKMKFPLVGPAS